jgi:hypothetical protein
MEHKIKDQYTGVERYVPDEEQSSIERQIAYSINELEKSINRLGDDGVKELRSINIKLWVIIFVFIFLPMIKDLLNDLF